MTAVPEILTMPRRAYSYKRISDPGRQAKGDGLNRQDDYAAQLAARNGWCLDDTLTFTDKGRSGFHGRHRSGKGQLKRFLEAVKANRIAPGSVLIVEHIDRLSREEVDEAHDLFKGILKAGIWIATEKPERIYRAEDRSSLLNVLEPLLFMFLAHEESKLKSGRIADKWQRRRQRAREDKRPASKKCPAWVKWTPDGFRLVESRARTVRTIFRLAREGMGAERITTWLQEHAKEHPPFTARGWTKAYVWSMLKKRLAIGEWQPRKGSGGYGMAAEGEPVVGYYPAAVTEEEWALAHAGMQGRRLSTGRPGSRIANLFTGLVREARSREKMSIRPFRGKRADGCPYYTYLVAGGSCRWGGGRGIRYVPFEQAVLRTIGELQPRDVLAPSDTADQRQSRICELTGRRAALDHRVGEIQGDIEDPGSTKAVRELRESLIRVKGERAEVVKELDALNLESLTGRAEALGETQSLIRLLKDMEGTDQEETIRQRLKGSIVWLVDEVWVLVQRLSRMRSVVHVQIYLRSGRCRYVCYGAENLRGAREWRCGAKVADFRAGNLGPDVAGHARAAQPA